MARIKGENTGFDDFFNGHGFRTKPFTPPRKTPGFVAATLGKLVACVLAIVLTVAVVGAVVVSQGVAMAEPAVKHWQSLPEKIDGTVISSKNVLYDVNGQPFAEIYYENRSRLKSVNDISKYAREGLIATEDRTFYSNNGFDVKGTARALATGSGGGSGITQQLVKNILFYNLAGRSSKEKAVEHSIDRKVKELKYALNYDKTHSKDQILLDYFNTVAFGAPTIYSIETAAKYFFDKPAKDLTLAESSALVGTVQNPVIYNMDNPKNEPVWKERQRVVLQRMVAEKYITQREADEAYATKLKFFKKMSFSGNCQSSKYPFYCDYVLSYMLKSSKLAETREEREAILKKGGLHIKTYLDPTAMNITNDMVKRDFGVNNRVVVPIAVVTPGTGGVSAIAVNRNYGSNAKAGETTINFPLNPSGTGSTYKMMTLAAALNNGFSEQSLTLSSPCPWMKPGYDTPPGGFKNSASCALQGGLMDYRRATAFSSNTWFVELESRVGVDKVKEFSRSVGLSAPDSITDRSLAYTLGAVENNTVDMAAAFATFANKGVFCPARPVVSYSYEDGSIPPLPDTYKPEMDSCRRVMSPQSASVVLKAMRAAISGEIPGAFNNGRGVAGFDTVAKSGTNELFNSSWEQLSSKFSLYINSYDPDILTRGIGTVWYKGGWYSWEDHPTALLGQNIMTSLIRDDGGSPRLDFNNQDNSLTPVGVNSRGYITVPSVIGMTPDTALYVMQQTGIKSHVSKTVKQGDARFKKGVIVEQNIKPGTQLPVGTKKEIVLYRN